MHKSTDVYQPLAQRTQPLCKELGYVVIHMTLTVCHQS